MSLKLRRQNPSSEKAFTLIEVLVSIFIGAIVLSVLYASFFQIIQAKDVAEEELEFYHEARVILSKLREDLEAAYPRGKVYSDSDDTSSAYPFFAGEEDGENSRVTFSSLSRERGISSAASDQAEVSYYVEPVRESDLFFLVRGENPTFGGVSGGGDPGKDSGGIRYPMSERVVRFDLEYLLNDEDEFIEQWDLSQTNSLPQAVKVTLIMRSPRGEDIVFNSLILIPIVN